MNKIRLGIIIPVYNEAENIEKTLAAIEERIIAPHKIYLVYDFDGDNTLPVAKAYSNDGVNITFVKNSSRGVVNAIKIGFKEAKEDYLLVAMADSSDDYSIVDKMCRLMDKGSDVVCGSRYMKDGKQIGGPIIKKSLSRMAGLSLRCIAAIPTHDITNSFKMYRKNLINQINIESDGGFEIGMEIALKAHFSGFNVTEIPCTWFDRQRGNSRFKTIKWLPKYLKWYFYAIRKNLIMSFGKLRRTL